MTKQIEDELNLPRLKDALAQLEKDQKIEQEKELPNDPAAIEAWANALEHTKKLDTDLLDVKSMDNHEAEMDEISKEAMQSYQDLIDLGHNVEAKHSGQIFEPATQMLKIALEARNSKIEKKLRLMRIDIDRARIERDLSKDENLPIRGEGAEVIIAGRNNLLDEIRKKMADSDKYSESVDEPIVDEEKVAPLDEQDEAPLEKENEDT